MMNEQYIEWHLEDLQARAEKIIDDMHLAFHRKEGCFVPKLDDINIDKNSRDLRDVIVEYHTLCDVLRGRK